MMFDEPVILQMGWWYVAWARVSGPSSDCGSHGQVTITTDDGYQYSFSINYVKPICSNLLIGSLFCTRLLPWSFYSGKIV